MSTDLSLLMRDIGACTLCSGVLPHEPRPVIQCDSRARILIAGQAPGSRVHASGVPFDDASGDRLRQWMGIDKSIFYDAHQIAILPMGFCYPGRGKSGDLPPQPECAKTWRNALLEQLTQIKLTLLIGQYAQEWHMGSGGKKTVTERVKNWKKCESGILPLPHPSPRNNIWMKKNTWFNDEVLPELRLQVQRALHN